MVLVLEFVLLLLLPLFDPLPWFALPADEEEDDDDEGDDELIRETPLVAE